MLSRNKAKANGDETNTFTHMKIFIHNNEFIAYREHATCSLFALCCGCLIGWFFGAGVNAAPNKLD